MARRRLIAMLVLAVSCGRGRATSQETHGQSGGEPAPSELSLSTFPAESRVFIDFEIPRLAASPLARRLIGDLLGRDAEAKRRLDQFLAHCHIDPERDVRSVTIAMAEPTQVLVIVRGKFDQHAVMNCVRSDVAAEGGAVHDMRVGGRIVYATEAKDGQKLWLLMNADHTIMAATNIIWLDKILNPTGPRLGPDMQALLARADRDAAAWGVGLVPADVGGQLVKLTSGEVTQPAKSISFAVRVDKGLAVDLRVDMAAAPDAANLAKFAKGQLDLLAVAAQRWGLGQLVSKTEIKSDDASVKLALHLDDAEVQRAVQALNNDKEQGK